MGVFWSSLALRARQPSPEVFGDDEGHPPERTLRHELSAGLEDEKVQTFALIEALIKLVQHQLSRTHRNRNNAARAIKRIANRRDFWTRFPAFGTYRNGSFEEYKTRMCKRTADMLLKQNIISVHGQSSPRTSKALRTIEARSPASVRKSQTVTGRPRRKFTFVEAALPPRLYQTSIDEYKAFVREVAISQKSFSGPLEQQDGYIQERESKE